MRQKGTECKGHFDTFLLVQKHSVTGASIHFAGAKHSAAGL